MAVPRYLPGPIMSARAGFHRHQTRRLRRHGPRELQPRELLAEQDRPVRRRAVHLEHVLCEIDADNGSLAHGCPLLQLVLRHQEFGTSRCRQGRAASTPSPKIDGGRQHYPPAARCATPGGAPRAASYTIIRDTAPDAPSPARRASRSPASSPSSFTRCGGPSSLRRRPRLCRQ